jgi:S-adenosyl methyltransferase
MTWKPPDFSKPNVACVHDVLLGGHDNFAVDRELAGCLLEICPGLGAAQSGRTRRSSRAPPTGQPSRGVRQFADLDTGLPAHPSAAAGRAVTPSVRLVYVDNAPVVTAHVRALLLTGDGDAAVGADVADPVSVLDDPACPARVLYRQLRFWRILALAAIPARCSARTGTVPIAREPCRTCLPVPPQPWHRRFAQGYSGDTCRPVPSQARWLVRG